MSFCEFSDAFDPRDIMTTNPNPAQLPKPALKLFVWEGVLTDYTDGIMFALAPDVEAARAAIIAKHLEAWSIKEPSRQVVNDLKAEPKVVTATEGFLEWGGG